MTRRRIRKLQRVRFYHPVFTHILPGSFLREEKKMYVSPQAFLVAYALETNQSTRPWPVFASFCCFVSSVSDSCISSFPFRLALPSVCFLQTSVSIFSPTHQQWPMIRYGYEVYYVVPQVGLCTCSNHAIVGTPNPTIQSISTLHDQQWMRSEY